jgi:hypothetical protein
MTKTYTGGRGEGGDNRYDPTKVKTDRLGYRHITDEGYQYPYGQIPTSNPVGRRPDGRVMYGSQNQFGSGLGDNPGWNAYRPVDAPKPKPKPQGPAPQHFGGHSAPSGGIPSFAFNFPDFPEPAKALLMPDPDNKALAAARQRALAAGKKGRLATVLSAAQNMLS